MKAISNGTVPNVPNILTESLLSLSQAAKSLPGYRGPNSAVPSTVFRWIRDGVKLPDGSTLKLEAIRIGSHWVTSQQALDRFFALQTRAHQGAIITPPPAPSLPESDRIARAREAGIRLNAIGRGKNAQPARNGHAGKSKRARKVREKV